MNETQSDDPVAALDDLAVALETAAQAYAAGSKIEQAPALSRCFATLAAERERLAAALRTAMRDLGMLPAEPDPDRLVVGQLWQRLMRALSPDERRVLIDDAIRQESAIAEAVAALCHTTVPAPLADLVEPVAASVRRSRRDLQTLADDTR